MASGPEAFFSIRSQFARSLSAFSVGAYILGIGDRHLGNFLIDKTDGTVVGIDFGLAFGCGLGLPVPELIPFRLTRQVSGCILCVFENITQMFTYQVWGNGKVVGGSIGSG